MEPIPPVKPGDSIGPFGAAGTKDIATAANAFLAMRVIPPLELVKDERGWLLRVKEGYTLPGAGDGGGGRVFFNDSQSATATCPSGSTGDSVTVSIAAGTVGSRLSVAAANDMALQIAAYRASSMLTCTVTRTINGDVSEMVRLSSGEIVIRGLFTNVGGFDRFQIALLKSDLTVGYASWKVEAAGGPTTSIINSIAADPSDNIYITGATFTKVENLPLLGLAQFNKNGGINGGYYSPTFTPPTVPGAYPVIFSGGLGRALSTFWDSMGNRMFVTGSFTQYGSITGLTGMVTISRVSGAGTSFNNSGSNNVARMWAGVGGDFYLSTNPFQKISSFGGRYLAFNPPVGGGMSGGPARQGLAFQSGKLILVGGLSFTNRIGGTSFGLARVDADTCEVDTSFYTWTNSGFAGASETNTVIVQPDGKIIVGGNFGSYGGSVVNTHLIRLNPDGSPDSSWTTSTDGRVNHLLQEPGGTILVCGGFDRIGPNPAARLERSKIARLSPNGEVL